MKWLSAVMMVGAVLYSCKGRNSVEAGKVLSGREYDSLLIQVAPFVIKKPDAMSYNERFEIGNRPFYRNYVKLTDGRIRYYLKTDSVEFFTYEYKDKASLYEHYRTFGGYVKRDKDTGKIALLNLLYQTPRCTKDELEAKGQVLFREMITTGNVNTYVGNKSLIHVPNEDFYYDTKRNRWDYTPNSSWRFLEEAKDWQDNQGEIR